MRAVITGVRMYNKVATRASATLSVRYISTWPVARRRRLRKRVSVTTANVKVKGVALKCDRRDPAYRGSRVGASRRFPNAYYIRSLAFLDNDKPVSVSHLKVATKNDEPFITSYVMLDLIKK